jgi:hypothetical protein
MINTINKDKLKKALHHGLVEVTFTKVNGDTRIMTCTLKEDLFPQQIDIEEHIEKKSKKANPDVLAVYDIKAEGWRSFRWDNLISYNGIVL